MTESPTVVDQGGRGSIPTDGIFTLPGQSTSAPTQTAQGSPTKAPVQEPAPGPSQGTALAPAPLPEPAAKTPSTTRRVQRPAQKTFSFRAPATGEGVPLRLMSRWTHIARNAQRPLGHNVMSLSSP